VRPQQELNRGLATLRIVWFAMLGSPALYLFVALDNSCPLFILYSRKGLAIINNKAGRCVRVAADFTFGCEGGGG